MVAADETDNPRQKTRWRHPWRGPLISAPVQSVEIGSDHCKKSNSRHFTEKNFDNIPVREKGSTKHLLINHSMTDNH